MALLENEGTSLLEDAGQSRAMIQPKSSSRAVLFNVEAELEQGEGNSPRGLYRYAGWMKKVALFGIVAVFAASLWRNQLSPSNASSGSPEHASLGDDVEFVGKKAKAKAAATGFVDMIDKQCAEASKNGTMSIVHFASPQFTGTKDWPHVNKAAYAAISECLTSDCNPLKLSGNKDIRSTYVAASDSNTINHYQAVLNNHFLMLALKKETKCSPKQFESTREQIWLEIAAVQLIGSYLNMASETLEAIGQEFETAMQLNLQMLLEETTKVTTTTTTTKKGFLKKAFHVIDVATTMLEECNGMLALSKTWSDKAGDTFGKYLSATGGAVYFTKKVFHLSEGSPTPTPSPSSQGDGLAEDNQMDEVELAVVQESQSLQEIWQAAVRQQRIAILSNWGRIEAAQPIAQFCALGLDSMHYVVNTVRPVIDWFALSALLPLKYAIYMQRNYGSSGATNCYDPCDDLPGGCLSVPGITSDESCEVSMQACTFPTRKLWLGQKDSPNNGPGAGFWRFLLSESTIVDKYINPRLQSQVTDAQSLSNAILGQCRYAPKVFVADAARLLNTGETGSSSMQPLRCDVFGAPWLVYSLADCGGSGMNSYYCTDSTDCSQNVANFNMKSFVPRQKHNWHDDTGLIGCCLPTYHESTLPSSHCDFFACDCATLAAMISVGEVFPDKYSDYWFGACSDNYAGASFESSIDAAPQGYIETSLGVSWLEVFEGYSVLVDFWTGPGQGGAPVVQIGGNNGAAYCSSFCANNWGGGLPSTWTGACCEGATSNGVSISCLETSSYAITCLCKEYERPFLTSRIYGGHSYVCPSMPSHDTIKNVGGNDGSAYCSAYCANNWNNVLPSTWKGACCLQAFDSTGTAISCSTTSASSVTCTCKEYNVGWLTSMQATTGYVCPIEEDMTDHMESFNDAFVTIAPSPPPTPTGGSVSQSNMCENGGPARGQGTSPDTTCGRRRKNCGGSAMCSVSYKQGCQANLAQQSCSAHECQQVHCTAVCRRRTSKVCTCICR